MAGVCFFFEREDIDVWSGKNLDAWHYAFSSSRDIDNIIIINRTNYKLLNPNSDKYTFNVVDKFPNLSGNVAGLITPWRKTKKSISLWDFDHKVDWYCFGSAAGELPNCNIEIFVPQFGTGALHSVHIASVVMLHRFKTLWQ